MADRIRVLGNDHPDTLMARREVANLLGQSGDTAAAVAELTALLADYERVLGGRHPETVITGRDLARWANQQGQQDSVTPAVR